MSYEVKKYQVDIEGVTPIIFNVRKKDIEDEKAEIKKNELVEWEENNWIRKAEFNKDGDVIIPARWLKSMIWYSARRTALIPHFATRKNETYSNYVSNLMIEINGDSYKAKNLEEYGCYKSARGKLGGGQVWRIRPMLEEWSWSYHIYDPGGRMKLEELDALLQFGGMFLGIGDDRICNYGRFKVLKLEEI